MAKKNNSNRIYLKEGQIIGCSGYTDLKIKSDGELELYGTDGGDYDFYDEDKDIHYEVKFDMDGNPKTNKNYGKMFYEI